MTAWQVTYWSPTVKPQDRRMANVSDGAIFSNTQAVLDFCSRIFLQGGKVNVVSELTGDFMPGIVSASLAEFDDVNGRLELWRASREKA